MRLAVPVRGTSTAWLPLLFVWYVYAREIPPHRKEAAYGNYILKTLCPRWRRARAHPRHNDQVELAAIPGLYLAKTNFMLAANGLISVGGSPVASGFSQTNENLTLPLPSIGVLANYHITPKLLTQVRTDFFYLKIGNFEGSMMEFYAGLEYRLFKPFALGAAYDRLVVNVQSNASNGFTADMNRNLLYLYGTLYLF